MVETGPTTRTNRRSLRPEISMTTSVSTGGVKLVLGRETPSSHKDPGLPENEVNVV